MNLFAELVSPSPGGEGRGEVERLSQHYLFGAARSGLFALTPALSPWEREKRREAVHWCNALLEVVGVS